MKDICEDGVKDDSGGGYKDGGEDGTVMMEVRMVGVLHSITLHNVNLGSHKLTFSILKIEVR